MKPRAIRRIPRFRGDDGQVSIFVVQALSLFLLALVGFAVDMTNLWFHRQMAQGAADAVCQAGIMDVLVMAEGGSVPGAGFTPGVAFDCGPGGPLGSPLPDSAPCIYGRYNGYDVRGGLVADTPSAMVSVSFPGTVPGSPPAPPFPMAPVPYLRTDVVDRVGLTFATLVMARRTSDVRAFAECGLVLAKAPIPIIVLNPLCSHAFQLSGNSTVGVIGGPTRSIQVNSNGGAIRCAAATTNAAGNCTVNGPLIDLTQGGPNFDGSNMGSFGGPSAMPPGNLPPPGTYSSPSSPISDPFNQLPIPSDPGLPCTGGNPCSPGCATSPCTVPNGFNGCPDPAGCVEYAPGRYDQPIWIKDKTAIFDPGLYYIRPTSYTNANGGLSAAYRGSPGSGCTPNPTGLARANLIMDNNSLVRPSTAPGDGSEGAVFYLTSAVPGQYGSVFIGSNSGTRAAAPFNTSRVPCALGSLPDPRVGMPPSLNGNVFLGACSGTYGDPVAENRRILFFQDRANNDANGMPNMQAGGGLLLAGTMYFHNCRPDGLGIDCDAPPAGYNAFFDLQGAPGSQTYVLGNLTTDQLVMGGGGSFTMALDPNSVYNILKATLLR